MTQDKARSTLEALGFKVSDDVKHVSDDRVAKNRVVNTDPAMGETVQNGSSITLQVSRGQVKIPTDLEGMSTGQAKKALGDLGLKVNSKTRQVASADLDKGKVISTDPKPGSTIKVGGSVTLLVSDGKVALPAEADLIGKNEDEVRSALSNLGLKVSSNTKDSPKDEGTVLSVDPEPGSTVDRGSAVTITVSSGNVSVPDLTGKNKNDAVKILQNGSHKLQVEVNEEHSDSEEPGTVLSQNPEGGAKLSPGSTVTLTVADDSSGNHGNDKDDDG
jgi:serine/threonine-protein kinase